MDQAKVQNELIEFRRCSREVENLIRKGVLLHALQVICDDKSLTGVDFDVLWRVGFGATSTDEELREECGGEPLLPSEIIQASLCRLESVELISTSWRSVGVKDVVATKLGRKIFSQCLDYYQRFVIRWEAHGL